MPPSPKYESSPTKQKKHKRKNKHRAKHSAPVPKPTLSLASQLKRLRGTADSTPPPPEWTLSSCRKSFLTPEDEPYFTDCLKTAYRGFCWQPPEEIDLHEQFQACFQGLEGLYLYDSVQAGGQKVSQTFCKRTLIGEPGSTYRYLGLRLFSHPWCNVNSDGDKADNDDAVDMGYAVHHQQALLQMGQLNQILQKMTQEQLNQQLPDFSLHGSCEFNLTLVNRMAPTSEKRDLKLDPVLQAKASVSWHKDSGLADFSSIAIYHTLQGTEGKDPWRVALRVPKAKTPSLAVPLPSGAIYYLLDDFNHSHEHAVLAGSHQLRYSSTHRVTKPGGTWQTLREKCRQIMSTLNTNTPKTLRARLQLSRELEFEWIRQWCIQGQDHAQLHPYWHEPVEFMQDCWKQIHENAMTTLQELEKQESTRKDKNDLCDILIEALEECVQLRKEWEQRLIDPFFSTLPESSRPFRLGKSVDAISMKDLKAILILARTCRPQTKKEQLLVASNWQALQGKLKANK